MIGRAAAMLKQAAQRIRRGLRTPRRPQLAVVESDSRRGLSDGAVVGQGCTCVRVQSRWAPKQQEDNEGRVYISPSDVGGVEETLRSFAAHPETVDKSTKRTIGNVRLFGSIGSWKRHAADCVVCGEHLREASQRKAIIMVQSRNAGEPNAATQAAGVHIECASTLTDDLESIAEEHTGDLIGDAL